jgi:HPt (histidine-containing phosphotransfer) domain-containing protein
MKPATRSVIHAGVPGRLDTPTLNSLLLLDRERRGSVRQLIELFNRDQDQFLENARLLLLAANFNALRSGLHTLKGSSASLGAARLSDLAAQAERRAALQDAIGVNASLTILSRELELSCEALRRIFEEGPARRS